MGCGQWWILLFVLSLLRLSWLLRREFRLWTYLRMRTCHKRMARSPSKFLDIPAFPLTGLFAQRIIHRLQCMRSYHHQQNVQPILPYPFCFYEQIRWEVLFDFFQLIRCEYMRVLAFLRDARKWLIFPKESLFSKIWQGYRPRLHLPLQLRYLRQQLLQLQIHPFQL